MSLKLVSLIAKRILGGDLDWYFDGKSLEFSQKYSENLCSGVKNATWNFWIMLPLIMNPSKSLVIRDNNNE